MNDKAAHIAAAEQELRLCNVVLVAYTRAVDGEETVPRKLF